MYKNVKMYICVSIYPQIFEWSDLHSLAEQLHAGVKNWHVCIQKDVYLIIMYMASYFYVRTKLPCRNCDTSEQKKTIRNKKL